jgi:hypothetical protein
VSAPRVALPDRGGAGVAAEVDDVEVLVDQHAGRAVTPEHEPVGLAPIVGETPHEKRPAGGEVWRGSALSVGAKQQVGAARLAMIFWSLRQRRDRGFG